MHREAAPDYEHEPFEDGWELGLGAVTVHALHTPGHRPEHSAFALVDSGRSPDPWAVLTGNSLFVGDIARPDLAVDKAEGARGVFHSLRNVAGCLAGGMTSWREERQPVERVERLTVADLHRKLGAGPARQLPEELDAGRPIATICGSGPRAAVAASLLKRLGAEHVIHIVDDGTSRWRREGWPIER